MADELPKKVPVNRLAWEKMRTDPDKEPEIPTAVIGRGPKRAWARRLEYRTKESLTELALLRDVEAGVLREILVDCDGDAICYRMLVEGDPKRRTEFIMPITLTDDLGVIDWGEDWKRLVPTVLTTPRGAPLGIAYSNRYSAIENFRVKNIVYPDGKASYPKRIMTLWSRRRGMWPKGLMVPKGLGPTEQLPDELEVSSGNYLEFDRMFYAPGCDALLITAAVPRGHGFCHETYRTVGRKDKAYKSCFHRELVLK